MRETQICLWILVSRHANSKEIPCDFYMLLSFIVFPISILTTHEPHICSISCFLNKRPYVAFHSCPNHHLGSKNSSCVNAQAPGTPRRSHIPSKNTKAASVVEYPGAGQNFTVTWPRAGIFFGQIAEVSRGGGVRVGIEADISDVINFQLLM